MQLVSLNFNISSLVNKYQCYFLKICINGRLDYLLEIMLKIIYSKRNEFDWKAQWQI